MGLRRSGDEVTVTCLRGRVDIRHPSRELALEAGQQARYGAVAVTAPARADLEQAMGWREGVLVFRDMPLAEAVAEINRYRPGRIMVLDDALAARRVSGASRPAGSGDRPDPRGLRRACAPAAQGHRVIELTQKIHENQFGFRAGKHDRRYRRRAARVTPGARHPSPT